VEPTRLHLHTALRIGEVDPRLFGGFLEHMGRAIYEGVFDPTSRHADADGFRSDVLEALRGLAFEVVRYPGGNFVSGYHWEHGVGPVDQRPSVRELAWNTIEPNHFGTDEFMTLCRRLDWQPMLAVNLGTGTPEEARNWVEYANGRPGTRFADQRVANGHPEPYGVRLWCLGNEMDGPWQLGHVPAATYAERAQQTAKLIKGIDPTVEVVACGSSGPLMPTWMEWDREVLEYVAGLADYVSLHRYVDNRPDDTADFLATSASVDRQIEEVDAVCRYVQAKRRSQQRAYLCFDEWNVWYRTWDTLRRADPHADNPPHLIEEVYNLEDALVVAGFLNSFLRHADVVKIANLAQIVNVIAPLLTRGDELLVQSSYFAFQMYSRRRHGWSLRVAIDGPSYTSARFGEVPYIDASAVLDGRRLHVFAINRSVDARAELEILPADVRLEALEEAEILTGPDAKAANDWDAPDRVVSRPFDGVALTSGGARVELPPLSLLAASFRLGG
jgi:alpha-N-arabinofuranosidase